MSKKRKPSCPACGSDDAIPVAYGLPDETLLADAEAGKASLGGCVIMDDSPAWLCGQCDHEFGSAVGR